MLKAWHKPRIQRIAVSETANNSWNKYKTKQLGGGDDLYLTGTEESAEEKVWGDTFSTES